MYGSRLETTINFRPHNCSETISCSLSLVQRLIDVSLRINAERHQFSSTCERVTRFCAPSWPCLVSLIDVLLLHLTLGSSDSGIPETHQGGYQNAGEASIR